jgi:hypothetical protein
MADSPKSRGRARRSGQPRKRTRQDETNQQTLREQNKPADPAWPGADDEPPPSA